MRTSWYARTPITAEYALNALIKTIPEKIDAIRVAIAQGTLDRANGARKLALERAWETRFRRWLGGYRRPTLGQEP